MGRDALSGIRILDLSRLLPFEYCTLFLADFGAEVLKIEEPGKGDYMRWLPPRLKHENAQFLMVNRNKESLTLNLRSEKGKDILLRLVKDYDVLFESFRPGVMDKLGLGYKELCALNPGIVYCSATGYGQSGPYKDLVGHDLNYISIAGILGATGQHLDAPVIPGIPFADMSTGLFCAFSILTGLMARKETGKGQHIDVSMTDLMVSYNVLHIANYLGGVKYGESDTLAITGESAYYNVYKTKDGKFICIANVESKFWDNFCRLVGKEHMMENQFADINEQKKRISELKELFLKKNRDEWIEFFKDDDVCVSPVYSSEEVLEDEHLNARGLFYDVEHPTEGKIVQIGMPAKFSDTPAKFRSPAPQLGENTNNVLSKLGYSIEEISNLKKQGVI